MTRNEKRELTKEKYLQNVRALHAELQYVPIQTDFVAYKLGTVNTIVDNFGGWANFIKEANLPHIEKVLPIDEDMKKLELIMKEFDLYPVKSRGGVDDPTAKLIFCNILADKYEKLRIMDNSNNGRTKGVPSEKIRLSNYLEYGNRTSVYYHLRDGATVSLRGYEDYEYKYSICKAGFNDDSRYSELVELKGRRDEIQDQMNKLMSSIIR